MPISIFFFGMLNKPHTCEYYCPYESLQTLQVHIFIKVCELRYRFVSNFQREVISVNNAKNQKLDRIFGLMPSDVFMIINIEWFNKQSIVEESLFYTTHKLNFSSLNYAFYSDLDLSAYISYRGQE